MTTPANTIRFLCVGDVMIHSRYIDALESQGPGFLFEYTSETLGSADILFGNLETVMSGEGGPVNGKLCLRGDHRYLKPMSEIGFNVVSLANNHAFDFGAEAFHDMVRRLRAHGIACTGGGCSLDESRRLETIEVNGIRLGFLAFSARDTDGSAYAAEGVPGVSPLDEHFVIEEVVRHRDSVDHLVVSLHWGVEYSEYPTPNQVRLGRLIIDSGARIIIGHHPHILQGYESYHGGYIFYSLGNFCDSDLLWEGGGKTYQSNLKVADRESMIVAFEVGKTDIKKVECLPLWLNDQGQPEIRRDQKGKDIEEKLARRTAVLGVPDFEKYWEQMILDKRVGNAFRIWLDNGSLLDKARNFKLSWFKTLWEMVGMYVQTKFSRSSDRYNLINPGKDKKPRPYCGKEPE